MRSAKLHLLLNVSDIVQGSIENGVILIVGGRQPRFNNTRSQEFQW